MDGDALPPRELLIQQATRLFADRGYAAVGVQEIVEACGVTKPTLYHHFGNKLGLFKALMQEQFATFMVRVSAPAAYAGDLTMALRGVVAAYFAFADEHSAFYRLLLRVWFSAPGSEDHEASAALFALQQTTLEQLFRDAARDHANMKGRHRAYAATLLGMINTYIGARLSGYTRLDGKLAQQAVHQFMHGILS